MSTNKKSDDVAEAAAAENAPDASFLIMFFAFVAVDIASYRYRSASTFPPLSMKSITARMNSFGLSK